MYFHSLTLLAALGIDSKGARYNNGGKKGCCLEYEVLLKVVRSCWILGIFWRQTQSVKEREERMSLGCWPE